MPRLLLRRPAAIDAHIGARDVGGSIAAKEQGHCRNLIYGYELLGRLTGEKMREFVGGLLVALMDWTERLRC